MKAPPLRELPEEVVAGLSPGVRDLVVWLNRLGFTTVDSGDGSNHAHGMECAMEIPMVAIKTRPSLLVKESKRLLERLTAREVDFGQPEEGKPIIEATYSPVDGNAIILLLNVLSKDVGLDD